MKSFATASALAQAHLSVNQFVETRGLSTEGDSGAARYYIVAPTTLGANDITLANGNIAVYKLGITPLTYPAASESQSGIVERATQAEVNAGIDTTRYVSPKTLKDAVPSLPAGTESARGTLELATNAEALAGIDTARAMTPANVKHVLDNRVGLSSWTGMELLISHNYGVTNSAPAMTALSEDTFAFFEASGETVKLFRVSVEARTLTQIGAASAAVTGASYPGLAAISQSRIALIAEGVGILAMAWNGTSFVQVGSTLSISGMYNPAICALNSTDVAVLHTVSGNTHLKTYRFNGSVWEQLGSTYVIGTATIYTGIAALSASTVVINTGSQGRQLQTMSWNGSTWSTLGAPSSPIGTYAGECDITALTSTDVIHIDSWNETLQIFRFSNNTWSSVGIPLSSPIPSGHAVSLCALTRNIFLYRESHESTIKVYRVSEQNLNIPYKPF